MPYKNPEDRRANYQRRIREDPDYPEQRRKWQAAYRARGGKRREYERLKADPTRFAADREQKKGYRDRLRDKVLKAYGHRCVCCGEKERDFLALDHIDRSGSEQREDMSQIGFHHWLLKEKRSNIRILCHNCNMATRFGSPCPHQT